MGIATPQSKFVPDLSVDDARDMYTRDATVAFHERRKGKGKKLSNEYIKKDTIAISSESDDNRKMAKRLRFDLPSPTASTGLIRVKPEVLRVEEANKGKAGKENIACISTRLLSRTVW